jgi:imidazole glycerol phosphate synthase glutamine amidotransferase subunit
MSRNIRIIPHGAGNIASLMELFHQLGYFPHVAQTADQITHADLAILPGVGASGSAMQSLQRTGFADALMQLNQQQRPLMGICVGAQLMFEHLEENHCAGLGFVQGAVTRIAHDAFNNGWSEVTTQKPQGAKSLVLKSAAKTFYFNHGYQIDTSEAMQERGVTACPKQYLAYFVRDHLCGIQFHPEKSQGAGLAFVRNAMKHYGL